MSVIHYTPEELANIARAAASDHTDLRRVCGMLATLSEANTAAYTERYSEDASAWTEADIYRAALCVSVADLGRALSDAPMLSYNSDGRIESNTRASAAYMALLCKLCRRAAKATRR